jgi:pimeloyl-ACP methyl ester carboxylesterase
MRSKVWRIVKFSIACVLMVFLTLVAAGLAYRAYRHRQIASATVIDLATGVDEAFFARIGGIDQWIAIRGQDRTNPILLVLHGGPGFALSPLPRSFLYSWTKAFTVVFWDQRGAGKTYGQSGALDPSVTIVRMVRDGVEVAEFVRARLGQPSVGLVGLSWGSMLGVQMIKARPDLFYAYIGTGQAVNQGKYRPLAYEQLLAEARARNDRRAIEELEANGPPPYDSIASAMVHTRWANAYEPGQPSRWTLISMVLFESSAGPRELRAYIQGLTRSQDHFRDAVELMDLPSIAADFDVPFFVFQGALDRVTPVPAVEAYIAGITAPYKELVLIPNAGHNVMATKSDEFLDLLVDKVRPLALRSP